MPQLPRFQPGILAAEHLNVLVDLANRMMGAEPSGAVERVAGGGLYVEPCREFAAIRLTGGGTDGKYAWTRVFPISTSPWWEEVNDSGTAVDEPAIEINATDDIDTTAPGPVVWAWREPGTRGWLFSGRTCA